MIRKQINAFKAAGSGLVYFFAKERHAAIHLIAIIAVTCAGFYYHLATQEWIDILFCFGLVVTAEALNTAIEKLGDMVSPAFHPRMKQIKDVAAGAVLFASLIAAIIGVIIFYPKIF